MNGYLSPFRMNYLSAFVIWFDLIGVAHIIPSFFQNQIFQCTSTILPHFFFVCFSAMRAYTVHCKFTVSFLRFVRTCVLCSVCLVCVLCIQATEYVSRIAVQEHSLPVFSIRTLFAGLYPFDMICFFFLFHQKSWSQCVMEWTQFIAE